MDITLQHHRFPLRHLSLAILLMASASCTCLRPDPQPTERPAKTTCISIRKAINYLAKTQITEQDARAGVKSVPGDWPHHSSIKLGFFRLSVRDSNSYSATFAHHALNHATPEKAARLGLEQKQLDQARAIRTNTIQLMHRFREPPASSASGAYGYWPRPDKKPNIIHRFVAQRVLKKLGGPVLNGSLAPIQSRVFPREFMIWPDSDTTAVIYVALQENAKLEKTHPSHFPSELYARWRDLPGMHRRNRPGCMLHPNSGVFLTWFPDPGADIPNEADIVVNANILFALARYNQRKTQGFKEAVQWINHASGKRQHDQFASRSPYYGDTRIFHYSVSRAFREGPVPELKPAMDQLVRELTETATRHHHTVYWPSEDPILSTACALLTILNAGNECGSIPRETVDGAARYLIHHQRPDGRWKSDWARFATTDSGVDLFAKSDAWTTAIALEALCRYQLQR